MSLITMIKKKLRKVLPADRVYLDQKLKKMELRFSDISRSIQAVDQSVGRLEEMIRGLEQRLDGLEVFFQRMDEGFDERMDGFDGRLKECREELGCQKTMQENLFQEIQLNRRDQRAAIGGVKQFINRELQRRDDWAKLPPEIRRAAKDRPVWVIKCPAPEGERKHGWGDYAYAVSLKRYLDRLGIYTVIDEKENWSCEENADVVVAFRGCHFYRPDRRSKNCLYIMWNISHPELVTTEEYELYDVVCVSSRHYAQKLKERLSIPVFPLLQCTDTELFYPAGDENSQKQWEYIFVGNSRGVARNCVTWAVEEGLPLHIWGNGWDPFLPGEKKLVEALYIENDRLPDLYRSARATLNDHWTDMLENQFVNNRIFDALACGLPVISDVSQELQEIFPDAVLYYRNKEEFLDCVRLLQENYEEIKGRVLAQRELIQREYSFEARAGQLAEIARICRSSEQEQEE